MSHETTLSPSGLCISLFGCFTARIDDGPPLEIRTRKGKALLAVLALAPRFALTREKLSALLWERSDEERARSSLRQELRRLRQALGEPSADFLRMDKHQISLVPERIEVDVRKFENISTLTQVEEIEKSLSVYQGDLLDGFVLSSEPFEDWLRTKRQRYQALAENAHARMMHHYLAGHDRQKVMHHAGRLLSLNPLCEDAYRVLIRVHAQAGERARALALFEQCKDVLQRELELEPEAETIALAREILDGGEPKAPVEMATGRHGTRLSQQRAGSGTARAARESALCVATEPKQVAQDPAPVAAVDRWAGAVGRRAFDRRPVIFAGVLLTAAVALGMDRYYDDIDGFQTRTIEATPLTRGGTRPMVPGAGLPTGDIRESCLRKDLSWSARIDVCTRLLRQRDLDRAGIRDALRMRGHAYRASEDFANAERDFQRAIKVDARDPRLYHGLGYTYFMWRKFGLAATAYTEALRLKPNPKRYFRRAQALYHARRYKAAMKDLHHVLSSRRGSKEAYILRGLTHLCLGNVELAHKDFLVAYALTDLEDNRREVERLIKRTKCALEN